MLPHPRRHINALGTQGTRSLVNQGYRKHIRLPGSLPHPKPRLPRNCERADSRLTGGTDKAQGIKFELTSESGEVTPPSAPAGRRKVTPRSAPAGRRQI